jgi:CHASE2 domain-containing sensor protein
LVIPLVILIKSDKQFRTSNVENEFLFQISVLSILLSGFFFQINYSSTNIFLLILILSIAVLLVNYLLNKSNKWIDFILSLLIFIILVKVFLLSSTKDAFHYSWYLGPINFTY